MKVLMNNYGTTESIEETIYIEPYPRILTCENCHSELEYEKSDLRMGVLGCVFIDCPLCGYDNMVEGNEEEIRLTANNVEFPTHFFHTSKKTGTVDTCNNEEIKKNIRKAIDWFRENKDQYSWFTCYGNLYIRVDRYDGDEDYVVMVTKDYYETNIPFEPEDY